jgi:hypothetical protein
MRKNIDLYGQSKVFSSQTLIKMEELEQLIIAECANEETILDANQLG